MTPGKTEPTFADVSRAKYLLLTTFTQGRQAQADTGLGRP